MNHVAGTYLSANTAKQSGLRGPGSFCHTRFKMEIQANRVENAVLIKVSGRMDAANADQFQRECEQWIAGGTHHILAELSDLQYVSSRGLGSFLAVAKSLQAKSGSIILCRLQGLPRQVFEMTRLIGLFPVFDSVDAALESLT